MRPRNSCGACKFRRRRCRSDCIFSPYFPANDEQKFAYVHRIFSGMNVGKMLLKIPLYLREDTVNALYFEANCRIQEIQEKDIAIAKLQAEIANYKLQIPQVAAASNLEVMPVPNIHTEQFEWPNPSSMMPAQNLSMKQFQWPNQAPMMAAQNISMEQFQWP